MVCFVGHFVSLLQSNQIWYWIFEGVFFIAQSVHFVFWNKIKKKIFFENDKNFLFYSYTPPHESAGQIKKNFFFDFIPDIKMYAPGDKNGALQKLISLLVAPQ